MNKMADDDLIIISYIKMLTFINILYIKNTDEADGVLPLLKMYRHVMHFLDIIGSFPYELLMSS